MASSKHLLLYTCYTSHPYEVRTGAQKYTHKDVYAHSYTHAHTIHTHTHTHIHTQRHIPLSVLVLSWVQGWLACQHNL